MFAVKANIDGPCNLVLSVTAEGTKSLKECFVKVTTD